MSVGAYAGFIAKKLRVFLANPLFGVVYLPQTDRVEGLFVALPADGITAEKTSLGK